MAKAKPEGVRCGTCGRVHPGLPSEWSFREPDEVFGLPYIAKYLRTRINPDLCTLDESRYFLRGHLRLPFTDGGVFGWGVWVEVSHEHHDIYTWQIVREAEGEPPTQYRLEGRLANAIPGYRATLGVAVDVLLREARQRPSLWLPSRSRHTLAREQATELRAALATLSDEQRAAVELRLAGWSGEQIGAVLGRSPDAVKMLRSRAIGRLRAGLAPLHRDRGEANDGRA